MLEELERFYDEHGILSTDFRCSFKEQCSQGCETFTGPKSSFVSSGYEAHSLPRLLFISLDSGSGEERAEMRLPRSVRAKEEERDVLALPKHKHWFRTHELAWHILRQFSPGLSLEEACHHFAHTNSAKCCMNNAGRKKANAVLFRNCKGFLKGELAILAPDIIVSQGNEAKNAIESVLDNTTQRFDEFSATIQLGGRAVFWLHTYHPANWGAFNKQRDFDRTSNTALGWVRYATMIHDFQRREAKKASKILDAKLLNEFVRIEKTKAGSQLLVRKIVWDGSHTPSSMWVVAKTLPSHTPEAEIQRSAGAMLKDSRFFRRCTECGERQPAGWMHSGSICQGCAQANHGIVY